MLWPLWENRAFPGPASEQRVMGVAGGGERSHWQQGNGENRHMWAVDHRAHCRLTGVKFPPEPFSSWLD